MYRREREKKEEEEILLKFLWGIALFNSESRGHRVPLIFCCYGSVMSQPLNYSCDSCFQVIYAQKEIQT